MIQLYQYDRVFIKDGTKDSKDGKDFSGMEGRIVSIGNRNEKFPFTVELEFEGVVEEYLFSETELIFKPEIMYATN